MSQSWCTAKARDDVILPSDITRPRRVGVCVCGGAMTTGPLVTVKDCWHTVHKGPFGVYKEAVRQKTEMQPIFVFLLSWWSITSSSWVWMSPRQILSSDSFMEGNGERHLYAHTQLKAFCLLWSQLGVLPQLAKSFLSMEQKPILWETLGERTGDGMQCSLNVLHRIHRYTQYRCHHVPPFALAQKGPFVLTLLSKTIVQLSSNPITKRLLFSEMLLSLSISAFFWCKTYSGSVEYALYNRSILPTAYATIHVHSVHAGLVHAVLWNIPKRAFLWQWLI